jgi:hypothetical protein
MAARKQARRAKIRESTRRSPFNRKIIGSNISEARDALDKILMKIEA